MRPFLLAAALAAAVPAAAQDPSSRALTLDEAYAAALKRSEEVAQRGETYAQVMAQVSQLWASVQPRIDAVGTQMWQDDGGGSGSFPIPTTQQTAAINARQPLFSGFREFLAVKAAKARGRSADLALTRAKQLLYQDVAAAYLDLLESRGEIATREAQVRLTEGRVKDLRGFVDLGRSRKSEVLAAEAQLAQDQADLETSRGLERVRQATLRFLTGLEGELAPAAVPAPAEPGDVKPFLDRAAARPDVQAAREDLEAAELGVSIQSRQFWPVISAEGNYYLKRPNNVFRNVKWDATLTGRLPIYAGGAIRAATREADAVRRFREQALSAAARRAELDVRSAHADVVSGAAIVRALENAAVLAEANSKAQAQDYRQGLVTNLDVLNSLASVQQTRLRLDRSRLQAYLARVRLDVAAGGPDAAR